MPDRIIIREIAGRTINLPGAVVPRQVLRESSLTESTIRAAADAALQLSLNALQTELAAEVVDRSQADAALQDLIDTINSLLTSNDVNLDQLQEIVTYIKANRATLDALGIASVIGLQAALDALTTSISAEVTRASTAEGVNAAAISAEVDRATAAEAAALQRANHTGTQLLATISDAGSAAAAEITDFDVAGAAATAKAEAQAYADALVLGLYDDRGNWDASGSTYPTSNGSGAAGAVMRGDCWRISAAGTVNAVTLEIGDMVRALVDDAGSAVDGDWAVLQYSGEFVFEGDARLADERIPTAAGLTAKFVTAKETIVDGDKLALLDSAAAGAPKHSLFSTIKSTLLAYFNTAYAALNHTHAVADVTGAVPYTGATTSVALGAFDLSAARSFSSLGSAALPSFSFTGDVDTGMWSPAANTLAWSTGGVERMRVDSSGNVGIGTTTPSAKLDVVGGIKTLGATTLESASASDVTLLVKGASGQSVNIQEWRSNVGSLVAYMTAGGTFSAASGSLVVSSSNGRVGIGTATPSAKLHAIATTEQARFGYDVSNYWNATTSATGVTTFDAVGSAAGFVFNDPITAPNQTLENDGHVLTRLLLEQRLMDPSIFYINEDFIHVTDAQNPVGANGFTWNSIGGIGTIRPQNLTFGFGVAGLHTAGTSRSGVTLQWDASNIIGGSGLIFSTHGLNNSSTVFKSRFQFNSLSCSVGVAWHNYNSSTYKCNRFFGLRYSLPASAWASSTVIPLNEYRRPTTSNGRRYYASVAGTTGGSEPTWPTTAAGTVVDGTVTWTEDGLDGNVNIMLQNCPNTSNEALSSTLVNTGVVAAINTWYEVVCTFVSGTTWNFTINGTNVGNLTMDAANNTSIMVPAFKNETHTATSVQLSVDYFMMYSRGIVRP